MKFRVEIYWAFRRCYVAGVEIGGILRCFTVALGRNNGGGGTWGSHDIYMGDNLCFKSLYRGLWKRVERKSGVAKFFFFKLPGQAIQMVVPSYLAR